MFHIIECIFCFLRGNNPMLTDVDNITHPNDVPLFKTNWARLYYNLFDFVGS